MKPFLLLPLFLVLLRKSHTGGYCYDKKCREFNGTYTDCDREFNTCVPGNSSTDPAQCTPGTDSSASTFWCGDSEACKHVEYTGKGYCAVLQLSLLQRYYRYVVVGVVLMLAVGLVLGACYCFWFKKLCFDKGWVESLEGRKKCDTLVDNEGTNT